ncbi:F-box/LRR-repeat protein At3g59190-like [Syzygium oleosum]|uniref:F-box/LRR-repeat protein At3g59190-like n=1 Tax=Syzygium oleosum TaxID=219896 RepID=UPI0024B931AB|nr:F-box/LRR-repeat protein At3g59190-like [Syzygium oleosum]
MKDAVRTSVLARQWEYLWTSTRNLLLDEIEFPNRTLFMNFVDRALVCRDCSSLNAFTLSCSKQSDAPRINVWIAATVRRNVLELDLQLYDIEQPYVLPCCLFRCKTLTKFDLEMLNNLRIPSLFCFRSIKVLRLEQVNFVDNDYTGEMFSFPALQELRLTRCSWTALKVLKISSPNLSSLNIGVCDEYDGRNGQVLINGASLTRFYYCGELFCDYNISGFDLLVEAYINVDMGSHPTVYQIHRGYKLLRKLSNVKKLTLLDLDEHNELHNTLPVFHNLTKLAVGDGDGSLECTQLGVILRRSPFLRSLEFEEVIYYCTFSGVLQLHTSGGGNS